jgi:hypothetical protein
MPAPTDYAGIADWEEPQAAAVPNAPGVIIMFGIVRYLANSAFCPGFGTFCYFG